MRSETAPTNLPSMYTGLPLMPAATLVSLALPSILPRIKSTLGPSPFFRTPTISIGTDSGSVPWNTVHAVAIWPGLMFASGYNSTGPAFGAVTSAPLINPTEAASSMPTVRSILISHLCPPLCTEHRIP